MLFVCPKCSAPLSECEGRAVCPLAHSYDRARGGYYNLLLGASAHTHGDNKEMVLARRAFLGAGYYSPLAERVSALVLASAPEGARVLDIGLGEGYYTDFIERALLSRDGYTRVAGFDISKDAVRVAGGKNKRISLAVASAYRMPISDRAVDVAVNMFSPLALSETRRVLKSGGSFIMAIPGRRHLYALKAAIYDNPYENEVADTALDGFTLECEETLSYQMELSDSETLRSLFMMTPYAYRTGARERERLYSLEKLDVEADFQIFVYKKN